MPESSEGTHNAGADGRSAGGRGARGLARTETTTDKTEGIKKAVTGRLDEAAEAVTRAFTDSRVPDSERYTQRSTVISRIGGVRDCGELTVMRRSEKGGKKKWILQEFFI